jgi:hypothetical protein
MRNSKFSETQIVATLKETEGVAVADSHVEVQEIEMSRLDGPNLASSTTASSPAPTSHRECSIGAAFQACLPPATRLDESATKAKASSRNQPSAVP